MLLYVLILFVVRDFYWTVGPRLLVGINIYQILDTWVVLEDCVSISPKGNGFYLISFWALCFPRLRRKGSEKFG